MAFTLASVPKKIHQLFSNLRTGIVLLILTVLAAALGTFILQRPVTEPDKMTRAYSPRMLYWLDRLTLTNVFHSWWFLTLLGLVSLSIVLVSIDRFPNAWRFYSRPYRKTDPHFRRALRNKIEIPVRDPALALNIAERVVHDKGWPVERIEDQQESALYSERHRFSVMAVYIVHASLLLIFLGGIIDGLLGYSGFIALQKGQTGNVIELRTGAKKQLPFALKCYSAGEETYADGSPKRWWSKLAVIKDGQEVDAKEIAVNDPLVYHGLRFYQASFGNTGTLDELKVQATPTGGNAREVTLRMNEATQLDPNTMVTLAEYIPDFFIRDDQVFKRSDDPVNPAFRLQVKNLSTGDDAMQWLFPAYNQAAQGQHSSYKFEYRDMQIGYFTGLEVSHEPGQWLVWGGVLLMVLGLGVAFYMVHMRVWIVALADERGKAVLWIGGQANKNRDRFEQKFQELADAIRTELEGAAATARPAQKKERELALAEVR